MNFLKAEIERKRKQLQEKNVLGPEKKYFKRADLIEKEKEEYFKRHRPKAEDVKRLTELSEGTSKSNDGADEKEEEILPLPRIEVVRRLRERLEPIVLFGETEQQALKRLRAIEINEPDRIEGIKNDFKEAMDKVDKVLDQESASGSSSSKEYLRQRSDPDLYETSVTYDELLEMIQNVQKGDSDADEKIVSEFIRFMMSKWSANLSERPDSEKSGVMGRRETTIHTQTRAYLKPLLRLLKKQTVTDDVMDSLVKMVVFCLQRDYILSHEKYMEMAVGNAPWPIGVTNAGIHARPARENIFSKNVAHVLNDETQRKYIQGLKRLITKAQEYYPTDPSKSVDYVKKDG